MLVDTNIMIIIIIMIIIFIIIIHHLSVTLFFEKSKALLIFTFANNVLYLKFFKLRLMIRELRWLLVTGYKHNLYYPNYQLIV